MSLAADRMLLQYRLIEKIGAGGMGEVWRATDTALGREVAIKVLPEVFARDAERLARFEREAKVLASLNHARIAQIFGLHEAEGMHFLAMELVRGEDLAQRLSAAPMALEEALHVGLQIADALETAHEHGVIHRDLKPANIVVSTEGDAKVLDFGLAKMFDSSTWSGDPERSPTLTSAGTQAGVILGTATYMSPEQARGRGTDRRTDIWSFGCVLYEMTTGLRLFKGDTISDTIALILQSEPDWNAFPAQAPSSLRQLIRRCLQRDPRRRLRDIGDARLELEEILTTKEWEHAAEPGPARLARLPVHRRFVPGALLFVTGAIVASGLWSLRVPPAPSRTDPLHVSIETQKSVLPLRPRIANDGNTIAFLGLREDAAANDPARTRVFVRRLDRPEARAIPGTEGATMVEISPDGQWLAYVAPIKPGSVQRRLFKVSLDGGTPPLVLAEWNEDWSESFLWLGTESIVVATGKPVSLQRIPTDGSGPGEAQPGEIPADLSQIFLHDLLPDGKHALATTFTWDQGYHDRTYVLDLESGALKKILEIGSSPCWSNAGYVVFTRQHTLLAVPFALGSFETRGGPMTLVDGLRTEAGAAAAEFDLSSNNTLLYLPGGRVGSQRRLVFVGPNLQIKPWSDEGLAFQRSLAVSPDERYVATTVMKPDDLLFTVWISELERPRIHQWQSMPGLDCGEPRWDAGGRQLYTNCQGTTDDSGVYVASVEGSDTPRHLWHQPREAKSSLLRSVHPSGRFLLVQISTADGDRIDLVSVEPHSGPFTGTPLFPQRRHTWSACFSPDGHWVCYFTDDAGRKELYVAPFDEGRLGRSTLVATLTSQETSADWVRSEIPNTYDLVFPVAPGQYESVRIHTGAGLTVENPRPYLDVSSVRPRLVSLQRLKDGRFLAVQQDEEEKGTHRIDLVLNFSRELQRQTR